MRTTALATQPDSPEIPLGDDIASRATVEEMVATYQKAMAEIRMGHDLIENAMLRLGSVFERDNARMHVTCRHHWHDMPTVEEYDEQIRRRVWQALVERLAIRRLMSIEAWDEFEKKMERENPPEITVENVTGMAAHFRSTAPDMLKAAVDEVFNWLRPHGDKFKTNTQLEIGERVVLEYVIDRCQFRNWGVSHYRRQYLTALENVFLLCDGKPQTQGKYWSEFQSAIEALPKSEPCRGKTAYFEFKGHKKGTLHLRFLRPDLVAKLSAIAGGARLRPASSEDA